MAFYSTIQAQMSRSKVNGPDWLQQTRLATKWTDPTGRPDWSVGSFDMFPTIDKWEEKKCRVKLNVWMFNLMDKRSFGTYKDGDGVIQKRADYFIYAGAPMKNQYMWWNWKDEFIYDSYGNYRIIGSKSGTGPQTNGGTGGSW